MSPRTILSRSRCLMARARPFCAPAVGANSTTPPLAMLAQVLTAQGATSRTIDHLALDPARIKSLDLSDVHAVVIGFLNAQSVIHARYIVRRLKRARVHFAWDSVLEAGGGRFERP